jgi:hypothetical protein
LVWLFAQNDRFKAKPLDKPGGGVERGLVVAMYKKDLVVRLAAFRRRPNGLGLRIELSQIFFERLYRLSQQRQRVLAVCVVPPDIIL